MLYLDKISNLKSKDVKKALRDDSLILLQIVQREPISYP